MKKTVKQEWNGVRIGKPVYEELKAYSKKIDRPMSCIIRLLWKLHRKEVK